jgi:hypothetical protein
MTGNPRSIIIVPLKGKWYGRESCSHIGEVACPSQDVIVLSDNNNINLDPYLISTKSNMEVDDGHATRLAAS